MESFFTDPDIARLPAADTRLLDLCAEPYPDGKRLRVTLNLTPFQQKPYLELTLIDPTGNIAATASIIEPVAWRLELTLHIRMPAKSLSGGYNLTAVLSFPDLGEIDRRSIAIKIPSPTV